MNLPFSRTRILGLAALSMAATSVAAQGTFGQFGEVVIAAGDQVPGLATGLTIFATNSGGLDTPICDQNGTLIMRARFADTGGVGSLTPLNDRGYLMGRAGGDLALVVRSDDPAPGIPGATLRSSSASGSSGLNGTPRISPFGELIFFASSIYDATTPANTPISSDTALFWGPVGGYTAIIREGTPSTLVGVAPGTNWGSVTTNFSAQYAHMNAAGQILCQFPFEISGPVTAADDAVMFTGLPGSLQIVSREGDILAAGLNLVGGETVIPASGSTMGFIGLLNENGQVLHEMRFALAAPVTTADDRALGFWSGGTDFVIVREDMQAPGMAAGIKIGNAGGTWSPAVGGFTRAGTTLLITDLTGGTITAGLDDRALFYGGLAGWTLVAQRNDPAPGIAGATFSQFNNSGTSVNAAGQVAFLANLAGTTGGTADDTALFYGTAGGPLTKLAQEGDAVVAAGLPSGWTYQNINAGTSTPHLNDLGQVLWLAPVTDGVNFPTIALAYDPTTGWRLVYDGSETVTTSLGSFNPGTLSNGGASASSDGSDSWFNNQGDWCGKFTPGSPVQSVVVRGHVGTMICEPSSVPATGGVPHNFHIDAGPSHPFELYVVLATSFGARPGFVSPFGPQNIPLNPDPLWTDLSLNAANSVVWINNLGITDANGKGIGAAGFVMPIGFPGFAGTTLHHVCVLLDFTLAQTHVSGPSAVKLY
jgi:hypothetical protein